MALKKSIEVNDSGITADYLRLSDIEYSKIHNLLMIQIEVYASQEARDAGKKPITILSVRVESADTVVLSEGTLLDSLYAKIKAMPEFKDAIDV